jgi:hypothetical protein
MAAKLIMAKPLRDRRQGLAKLHDRPTQPAATALRYRLCEALLSALKGGQSNGSYRLYDPAEFK